MNTIPQYRKLYEILRRHILSGAYEEGSLLPSENELCALHGLTRPTVRQALESLVKEGLIIKRQGKGSIVRKPPQSIGILSIEGTASAIGDKYLRTVILQKPVIRRWEEDFPFELSEIERESGAIYLERLRYVDGKPVFYDINHLPNINLPRFTSRSLVNRSLFETLRNHYQIQINGGEQRIQAIRCPEDIANLLKIKKGDPVLYLQRKMNTNREGFNIYSVIWFNSANHTIFGRF
jgi:GntR family transcriptional regulator/GntR family frlABCD operon transcriptional regulator